ncbi:hypothetical protein J6590_105835, partial [Homalodisca vitripennis]
MVDSHNNESEIRQFLEEPSPQLDNENAWLSEDEGWFGEPADDSDADPTYVAEE